MAEIHSLILKSDSTQIRKSDKDLDNLGKSAISTEKATTSLTATIGALSVSALAASAAYKVLNDGFAYNRAIEEARAGLVSLSVAIQDKSLPVLERYKIANEEVNTTLAELQRINAETPHTLNQTNEIYKAMYISMKNVGASSKDIVNITKQVSIAAGAAGIDFQSLLAGVDGLASGTVLANSDLGRFLNGLGLTNDVLKNSTDIVGLLNEKLGDFQAADTMGVAVSNLTNQWDILAGRLTQDIFESTKQGAIGLSSILESLNKRLKDYQDNVESVHDIHRLSTLADAQRELEQLGKTYADLINNGKGWLQSTVNYNAEVKKQEALILSLTRKINRLSEAKEKSSNTDMSSALGISKTELDQIEADLENGFEESTDFAIAQNKRLYEERKKSEEKSQKEAEKKVKKFNDLVVNQLGNSISNAIQDGFDGNFDLSNIVSQFSGSIGQALVSQEIQNLANPAVSSNPYMLAAGIGTMALSSFTSSSDRETQTEKNKRLNDEAFKKFIDGLDRASKALEQFGNVGSSVGERIDALNAEIDRRARESTGVAGWSFEEARQIVATFQDVGIELQNVIKDNLAETLDISKLSTTQLEEITANIDIETMKSLDTEFNNIALRMKRGTSTAEDQNRVMEILSDTEFRYYKDFADAISLVGDRTQEATNKMMDIQKQVNNAYLGTLSTLTQAEKLTYANNLYRNAITQEDKLASSMAITELSLARSRTKEDYAIQFARYINDIQSQVDETTLTDVGDKLDTLGIKLDTVNTNLVNVSTSIEESAIHA